MSCNDNNLYVKNIQYYIKRFNLNLLGLIKSRRFTSMLGSHFFPNHVLSKLFIIIPEFAVLKILNRSSRVSGGSSMSNFPEEVKDGFFN